MEDRDKIPFIDNVDILVSELNDLYQERLFVKQNNKSNIIQRTSFSKNNRQIIFRKTGGRCHICGIDLEIDNFSADHVKPHSQEGEENINNYLPSCPTCNGYRWNYSPAEIQWILKLGVWLKTKIIEKTDIGKYAAVDFIKDEVKRESRRKKPRNPKKNESRKPQNLFPIKGKHKNGFIEPTIEEIKFAREILESYCTSIDLEKEDIFSGKSFVISGESEISRKELESLLISKGGTIKKTISKNIDFLVIGNFYGLSKLMKVKEINIRESGKVTILTQDNLKNILVYEKPS